MLDPRTRRRLTRVRAGLLAWTAEVESNMRKAQAATGPHTISVLQNARLRAMLIRSSDELEVILREDDYPSPRADGADTMPSAFDDLPMPHGQREGD
jgi:hypothetical protein